MFWFWPALASAEVILYTSNTTTTGAFNPLSICQPLENTVCVNASQWLHTTSLSDEWQVQQIITEQGEVLAESIAELYVSLNFSLVYNGSVWYGERYSCSEWTSDTHCGGGQINHPFEGRDTADCNSNAKVLCLCLTANDTSSNPPTSRPSNAPTQRPSDSPTQKPSNSPTNRPSDSPTSRPSNAPTQKPSNSPTSRPSNAPTTGYLYLTLERTSSAKIQIMEVEVFLKSNPSTNAILNSLDTSQDSTVSSSANAVDGVKTGAGYSETNAVNPSHYWQVPLGAISYVEIERINLYSVSGGESLVGTTLNARRSLTLGYTTNVTDRSNVVWSMSITVQLPDSDGFYSYTPVDVEYELWNSVSSSTGSALFNMRQFGMSVAMNADRNVSVVGSSAQVGGHTGSFNVYTRSTGGSWTLHPNSPFTGSGGTAALVGASVSNAMSVDIWHTTIVYSCPLCDTTDGKVWVFDFSGSTWVETASISPSDGSVGAWFGYSLALYNKTLAIGGPYDNGNLGATWVYKLEGGTWARKQKIVVPGTSAAPQQGFDVAVWEDTLVITGPNDDYYHGHAWVYVEDSGGAWAQQGGSLSAVGPYGLAYAFGHSVDLYRDTLLVGSCNDNDPAMPGAAYVFDRVTGVWSQTIRLTGSNPYQSRRFGSGVSIYEDMIAVSNGVGPVAATLFRKELSGNWREVRKASPATFTSIELGQNSPGNNVCIRADQLIVGGYSSDQSNNEGTVWFVSKN